MGNGRWWSGRLSGKSVQWGRIGGAVLILSLAACLLLGSGSRRYSQQASAPPSISPLSAVLGKTASKSKLDPKSLLSHLALIFEPNQGQADSSVKFVSRGQGYSLYLDENGALLAMQTANGQGRSLEFVRMTLVGANPAAAVGGSEPLPGTSNYFIGNDPKKWRTGIPQFAGVRYQSVYPGIDLVFYGSQGHLEYDFKIAPGADPSQAELQFDGASKLQLSGGDLMLTGTGASVRLQAPRIYQRVADRQQPVPGRFILRAANRVGFEIGPYDLSRELVIDPTIEYSTYFGGQNGAESYPSIAVNGNGFIYLAGSTTASNTPPNVGLPVTANALQSTLNGVQNIFILELDPTAGTGGVVYLTYLGGSGTDTSVGIAVDSGNNAYVAGTTTSPNFPTKNGFQSVPEPGSAGTSHVFVSEITQITSSLPQLTYSTYLSGSGNDVASGMAIDSNRDVFVTGTTSSTAPTDVSSGFPSTRLPVPYQQSPSAECSALNPSNALQPCQFFVTEVNTNNISAGSVPYSTYFGGGTPTGVIVVGGGIAVDTTGNVYFSGTTNFYNSGEGTNGVGGLQSTDFPIANAYQPCLDTPPPTNFVPPVTCTAPSTTPYPTDAFVAKLNPANAQTGAAQLLFSTYFGGTQTDSSTGIAIDVGPANVYITGTTTSPDFVIPTGIGPFQQCLDTPVNPAAGTACPVIASPAPTDAYVARFSNPSESSGTTTTSVGLGYFSYLGGTGNDSGLAIAVDTAEGAWVTGATSSGTIGVYSPTTGFPVTTCGTPPLPCPIQSALNGPQNAFFAHINTTTLAGNNTLANYATYFGGNGVDRGTSITLDPSLNIYLAGDTTSTNLQTQGGLQSGLEGTTSMAAFAVQLRTATDLCIRCIAPVLSPATGAVSAGTPITVTFTIINEGPDLATNITVTGQFSGVQATFNSATATSGLCSAAVGDTQVCTVPSLQSGSTSTVTFSVTPTKPGNGLVTATVTNSNNTNISNTNSVSFTATDYSLSISPSSATVVAGNPATFYVQVAPAVTFGANVSLSCTGLPAGASCGFSPSTLVFNGPGSQSSVLSLTTTARPIITISSTRWRGPIYALWLMAPGMALIGFGRSKRRRDRILGWLALATLLFAFLALQPACSTKKQIPTVSGTPAGSYNPTVTASSGSFSESVGFSLTVQ